MQQRKNSLTLRNSKPIASGVTGAVQILAALIAFVLVRIPAAKNNIEKHWLICFIELIGEHLLSRIPLYKITKPPDKRSQTTPNANAQLSLGFCLWAFSPDSPALFRARGLCAFLSWRVAANGRGEKKGCQLTSPATRANGCHVETYFTKGYRGRA